MKRKAAAPRKPGLTDVERHKRFVETARAIGADEGKAAFERAFSTIVPTKKKGLEPS